MAPVSKVYPVEYPEPLEELAAKKPHPLSDPSIVACFSAEDVRILERNILRLSKWGFLNQNTIEKINKEAK